MSNHFRKLIGLSLRTVEIRVCFLIAGEDLLLGIPCQCAAKFARDVAQLTDRANTVSDLYIGGRLGARTDTVQPVLEMMVALVHPDGVGRKGLLRESDGNRVETATVLDQPSTFP